MPTVDTLKFDIGFRNHPNFNQLVNEINRSPHLVDLIDRFPGKITLGTPGSGGFFSPADQKVNIDKNWVDGISNTLDPGYLGRFTTMIGHELGHAVEPGGLAQTNGQMTLQDYVGANLKGEGVAILTEYRVAKDSNTHMWSSGYDPNSLQAKLDAKLVQHAGNTSDSQFASAAMALGVQAYAQANPSNSPHVTYEQYYSTYYVLNYGQHNYTTEQISRIDWKNLTSADVAVKPEIAGQKREFANVLPLLPSPSPAVPANSANGAQSVSSDRRYGENGAGHYAGLMQGLLRKTSPEAAASPTPDNGPARLPQVELNLRSDSKQIPGETWLTVLLDQPATEGSLLNLQLNGPKEQVGQYLVEIDGKAGNTQPTYLPVLAGINLPLVAGQVNADVKLINTRPEAQTQVEAQARYLPNTNTSMTHASVSRPFELDGADNRQIQEMLRNRPEAGQSMSTSQADFSP